MAEHLRILYSADAVDDLDCIFGYISEDNRTAALHMVDRIESTIRKLAGNPRIGIVLEPMHGLSMSPWRALLSDETVSHFLPI